MNKLGDEGTTVSSGAAAPAAATGSVSVDITPLEERLAQLTNIMATKADIEPVVQELAKLRDERMKRERISFDRVNSIFEGNRSPPSRINYSTKVIFPSFLFISFFYYFYSGVNYYEIRKIQS